MRIIFISHSSQNEWVVSKLVDLIEYVAGPEIEVFCSSIEPGDNYRKTIFQSLRETSLFVAVLSNEYWESKYCIFELGAAYERFCFDEANPVVIQPLLVPPLDKGQALANTPLVEMQLTDLTDSGALMLFLKKVAELGGRELPGGIEVRAAEFAAFVHRNVLQRVSLLDEAQIGAYFDERPENLLPRDRIVRYQRLSDDSEDERVLFSFHLSRLPYDDPSFASVALLYWDELNLKDYLAFDRDAALCLDVDNVDGALRTLTVEIKKEDNVTFHASEHELVEGMNEVRIPLRDMPQKPLEVISQISLVVHPAQMNSLDGEVVFGSLRVDFTERNIFEEQA